jgi:hypothetical protein
MFDNLYFEIRAMFTFIDRERLLNQPHKLDMLM